MLAVVGTVPDQDFPLAMGRVVLEDDVISVQVLDEKAIISGHRHV